MDHNFRVTTNGTGIYISKAGDDNNDGLTPQTPIATFSRFMQTNQNGGNYVNRCVIGTGAYELPPDWNGLLGYLQADGTVKILGDGVTSKQMLGQRGAYPVDIYFDRFAGFNFRPNPYDANCVYSRCTFKVVQAAATDLNNSVVASDTHFFDCIFYNVNGDFRPNQGEFVRCLFLNCNMKVGTLKDCYVGPGSAIYVENTGSASGNNNVDPACQPGAGQGINLAGAGWVTMSAISISQQPQFNSVVKEDFTLQASSPHVLRGIGPAQYRYANSFYGEFTGAVGDLASTSNFRFRSTGTNQVIPNLDVSQLNRSFEVNGQGGLVLAANTDALGNGYFTTGRIPFADVPDEITVMLLKAGLNFNASYPALEANFNPNQPEVNNNNVADASGYSAGSAGRNPNRLSYFMRWSTKLNPNQSLDNVSDWITGKSFVEFEWNQKPLWNPASYDSQAASPDPIGNGDARFVPANGQSIQCTYYQLMVVLRNDYYR